MFGSTFTGNDDEPEDYFTWEQRTMTTPNTPANGGQILTDERINEVFLRHLGHAAFPKELAAVRAIEADLRASLAAPAIPTVDRDLVPSVADDEEFDDLLREFWKDAHDSSIHTALKDDKGSLVAYVDKRCAAAAQPAAQVAVTGEAANPMFNIIPTMTKADEADAAKGICPACKYLGLKEINIAHGMRFMQCRKCKDIVVLATPATVKTAEKKPLTRCAASRDGDCTHPECPQLRDNEPHATGRHCPIDTSSEDEQ